MIDDICMATTNEMKKYKNSSQGQRSGSNVTNFQSLVAFIVGHIPTKLHQFLISSFRDLARTDRRTDTPETLHEKGGGPDPPMARGRGVGENFVCCIFCRFRRRYCYCNFVCPSVMPKQFQISRYSLHHTAHRRLSIAVVPSVTL